MIARAVIALVLISRASPAFALDDCFTESIGPWRGHVLNEGRLETLDTEFRAGPDDTLVGGYRMHGSALFDGALSGFHQTGACEADFVWTDKFGKGIVHIWFAPDRGKFIGVWGIDAPMPGWIFDGYRTAPQTSMAQPGSLAVPAGRPAGMAIARGDAGRPARSGDVRASG